jgi:hypothetical protein
LNISASIAATRGCRSDVWHGNAARGFKPLRCFAYGSCL